MNAAAFIASLEAVLPTVELPDGSKGWVLSRDSTTRELEVLAVTGRSAGLCVHFNYRSVKLCGDYVKNVPGR